MTQQQTKVLLVDDEEMNVLILKRRLLRKGFIIAQACDGLDAIDCIRERGQPDLVLMDLMMPRMDGWEATRMIKKSHPDVKVIAVSAKVDEDCDLEAKGFDAFCAKPINFQKLALAIERTLESLVA
ncbi:response regulator [Pseudobacteriovorax antillogorgiicola]|uniref:CheY chemotaxis protein or a CheY-like REC (Receiver) domain n=1 Tax=Pseudobacteriovorax antillogorgiicola TaxID=1513793 RepID=A0A1Y6C0B7_9BACT|nr:response regulator [Pseudobacteriovorax antillogorgiicola]TCS52400.1 CheY-like chemotaxis protein [Pseudobacteriovorax antillogorgiicola]SMF29007.1 CheY chemotaxis protein or a CheY-like REC (receiver) domain [Pseudobacteriovorax antillogorgiicola]